MPDAEHAGDDRGPVGAERQEHGVAERQQAGVAEQQIEAEQRDGVAEERHQQVGVERAAPGSAPGRARRQRGGDQQERASAHHVAGLPNSPEGLSSSTPMTIR